MWNGARVSRAAHRPARRRPGPPALGVACCACDESPHRRIPPGRGFGLGGRARVWTSAPHATPPTALRPALGAHGRRTPVTDRNRHRVRRVRSTGGSGRIRALSPDPRVRREHDPRGVAPASFDEARRVGAHPRASRHARILHPRAVRQPRVAIAAGTRDHPPRGGAPRRDARSRIFLRRVPAASPAGRATTLVVRIPNDRDRLTQNTWNRGSFCSSVVAVRRQ